MLYISIIFLLVATTSKAFQNCRVPHRVKPSHLCAKRGRGTLGREVGPSRKGIQNEGSGSFQGGQNWCPIPEGQELPKENGQVVFIDTELPTMKVGATNPTGAVATVRYEDKYYCFSHACPSCKVPLSKAKIFKGNEESKGAPRLGCDFCKTSYSLEDGAKLSTPAESGGLFSGVVKNIFGAQDGGNLKMYQLGERKKKMVIVVD